MKKITSFLAISCAIVLASCNNSVASVPSSSTSTSTSSPVYYQVRFNNYDDTELYSSSVESGHSAVYAGDQNPTRESDETYTYSWSGWDKSLDNIQADTIFTATYSTEYISYSVTFMDYLGETALERKSTTYGGSVSYTGVTPTMPSTVEDSYVFADAWVSQMGGSLVVNLNSITANMIVYPKFTSTKNRYSITFKDYNDDLLDTQWCDYGGSVTYKGTKTPSKPSTVYDSYAFAGAWLTVKDGDVIDSLSNVIDNRTVYPKFTSTAIEYTVTFIGYDGTTKLDSQKCGYNGSVTYGGETPTEPSTLTHTYVFSGKWSSTYDSINIDNLNNVVADRNVYAIFNGEEIQYTITFKNYDGSETLATKSCSYDSYVVYDGVTPTKPSSDQYKYTFASVWLTEIGGTQVDNLNHVTSNRIVYPKFNEEAQVYTVIFKNYNNDKLDEQTCEYNGSVTYGGVTPTKNDEGTTSYVWSGWDGPLSNITSNCERIAQYDSFTSLTYAYDSSTTTYYVSKCPTAAVNTSISSIYDDGTNGSHAVSYIGQKAFYQCAKLTSIVIPKSITTINDDAFALCSTLKSVTFEQSSVLTNIGNRAFQSCIALESIDLPDSVTSIKAAAFNLCSLLKTITMPDQLTTLGVNSFNQCKALESVTIPNKVTGIPDSCFSSCIALTSVTFASTCIATTIGDSSFANCTSLLSFVLPASVTDINASALSNCVGLTSLSVESDNTIFFSTNNCICRKSSKTLVIGCDVSVIPSDGTVKKIGSYSFSSCAMTSIVIPNTINEIYNSAFYCCNNLTTVNFDSDSILTTLGAAFEGCPSFTSFILPSSVTVLSQPFNNCAAVTSLSVETGNTKYHSIDNCIIATVKKELVVGCRASIIPSDGSVTSIASKAFQGSGLTTINIPSAVSSIGSSAFLSCNSLQSVTFDAGSGLLTIGASAFESCSSLTSIVLPDTVKTINDSAFKMCTKLTSIIIPISVTNMPSCPFLNCSSLIIYCLATAKPSSWYNSWYIGANGYSFYSETYQFGYWHYVDGVPTIWTSAS